MIVEQGTCAFCKKHKPVIAMSPAGALMCRNCTILAKALLLSYAKPLLLANPAGCIHDAIRRYQQIHVDFETMIYKLQEAEGHF